MRFGVPLVISTVLAAGVVPLAATAAEAASCKVKSLYVSPSSVVGGVKGSTGKVTVTCAAPRSGLSVKLWDNSKATKVASSVRIARGKRSATFKIYTYTVKGKTTSYVTAKVGSSRKSVKLTVNPKPAPKPTPKPPTPPPPPPCKPALSKLSLNAAKVTAGASVTGTITMTCGPYLDAYVTVRSDRASVQAPRTVKVPANQSSATFTIPTKATYDAASENATVTAAIGGLTRTATLAVQHPVCQAPAVTSFAVAPAEVRGGEEVTATASLVCAPKQPVTVAVEGLPTPVTITVPAGQASGSVRFPAPQVTESTTFPLTAGGRTAQLTVLPEPEPEPAKVTGIQLAPSYKNDEPGTGTVTVSGPIPAEGLTLYLTSSDPKATVPATVTVPAGATSVDFPITATGVEAETQVTIRADLTPPTDASPSAETTLVP